MFDAKRDANMVTTLLAVSNADGVTPVVLWADPTTHRLLVDVGTSGFATTALDNLASVAINTTLVSDTDNTDALGTSAKAWSDLFLGSGGVITFNSAPSTPDITLTHSANTLTFDGGTFALGTNSITMTGSLGATGARLTAGFFADLTVTNAITGSVTGSAATLTTTRTLWGQNFNGSANVTGDITLGVSSITMTGSLGATGARVTKGWFTDLEVTNAIAGSVTGNAATVTNATLTTALTVNTGTVTLIGNVLNTSALTIGAGAVSVSGANTGDQTITNTSDATSHTVTLSASGGTIQFIEGANITLTTGGTGSAGTLTIAAGGGGSPRRVLSSIFETSGRFGLISASGGTNTFGISGVAVATSATAGGSAGVTFHSSMTYQHKADNSLNPAIYFELAEATVGTDYQAYMGFGQPSTAGGVHAFTNNHTGIKIIRVASGTKVVSATNANGTTETATTITWDPADNNGRWYIKKSTADAKFYLDGALLATHTTNLQTANNIGGQFSVTNANVASNTEYISGGYSISEDAF